MPNIGIHRRRRVSRFAPASRVRAAQFGARQGRALTHRGIIGCSTQRRFHWMGVSQALVALTLLSAAAAFAQATSPAMSIDEQFVAYHDALSGAANRLLSSSAQPLRADRALPADTEPKMPRLRASDEWPVAAETAVPPAAAHKRLEQLRPLLEPVLREERVPAEVMAVALVESGGRQDAFSPKGALGLWQLMPQTARRYGLTVWSSKDERLDLLKATRAAARYLRDLYVQFGDWTLAFAAYNAGEHTVQRAIERVGSNDFLRLGAALPLETRRFVPAVAAAMPMFGGARLATFSGAAARPPARVVFAVSETSIFDSQIQQ
jgi:soluble lytic murein transglycosylase-like protein